MVSVLENYKTRLPKKPQLAPVLPQLKIDTPNPGGAAPPAANFMSSSTTGGNGGAAGAGMGIQPLKPMADVAPSPIEVQSGDWRSNKSGRQYGVLRAVDQMGETALGVTNAKLQAFNARRGRENQSIMRANDSYMSQMQSSAFGDGGGEAGGSFQGNIGLDAHQQDIARNIIEIGRQRGMSDDDIKIGLMTGLAESGLRNLNHGDAMHGVRNPDGSLTTSFGVFQQQTSQGWGTREQVTNPIYATNKFYDALSKTNRNGVSHWQAAQNVQRSAFSDGSNYRAQANKAYAIFGAYRKAPATTGVANGGPVNATNAAAGFINSHNNRYLDFDGAFNAQCVDLFNYYNQGFVGGGFITGVSGAKDLWGNPNMNRNYTAMSRSIRPQMGDVAVWGGNQGGGYGHVAVVVGSNPDGSIRVLHSNATAAGSKGPSVISNMPADVLGYYRPKKLMG